MSGMNEYLAAAYGTGQPSPAPQEDAEKVAHAEMFAKLAAENGLDLSQMSEEEISAAWNSFYAQTKTAAEEPPPADHGHKHKHKEAAALAEFEQTKTAEAEWQKKTAEADFLGRQMAHAYVDELRKIAEGTKVMPERKFKDIPVKEHLRKGYEKIKNIPLRKGYEKIKEKAQAAGSAIKEHGGTAVKFVKEHPKSVGGAAAGAAALGTGAYLAGRAGKHKRKHGSALDDLAAQHAIVKAAEAGYDEEQALDLMASLLEQGPAGSEKIAMAEDFNQAIEIRSLELLEAAGYPVNWPQG